LHNTVKAAGLGQQGRTRSAEENARALLHVDTLMAVSAAAAAAAPSGVVRALSYDAAVKKVAAAEQTTPNTLRRVRQRFEKEGQLAPPSPKRMKIDDPHHPRFGEGGPSLEIQNIIHGLVKEAADENTYISLSTLRAAVFAATDQQIPKSTMHTWVASMGFNHGKKKLTGLPPSYSNALVRRYLLQYTKHRKAEKRGGVVLVWMDESYIHQGYCSKYTWSHPTNTVTPNRTRGNESGKRLIIISAITKDGVLAHPDAEPSDNLEETCESASIVTSKLSADGFQPEDYHDTMNGERFLAWVENRLFPAFNKLYEGKKMVLILDNASFHKSKDETWKSVNGKSRTWLEEYLFNAEVEFILGKDGRKIRSTKFTSKKHEGGPTDAELRDVVRDHIKSHWSNSTVLEQLFAREGHQLLWTPPYESWLQPIELVWARIKHEVARQSKRGRKWQETQDQTRKALKNIDKNLCTKLIEHTHKLMDEWLKSDDAGTLPKHAATVAALTKLTVAQRAECTNLKSKVDVEVALEEAEKEN